MAAFSEMGRPFPFVLAEDVEAILRERGRAVARATVAYTIDFPDTPAARLSVLRFLLGGCLDNLDTDTTCALFDDHAQDGRMVMATRPIRISSSMATEERYSVLT